ncbi:MAG: tRNA (N6-threonylcarbamoyladenosine(37)-N6)-methyltransferase TrmO [Promethearchaeota archaeon]
MTVTFKAIGYVKNGIKESVDPYNFAGQESELIIYPEYKDALYKIEEESHIQVIFYLHKSPKIKRLKGPTYFGTIKGVFASRSPIRPNPIGLTTVPIVRISENKIIVKDLDAIDGTPILDIKPYSPRLDHADNHEGSNKSKNNPEYILDRVNSAKTRMKNPHDLLIPLIRNLDLKALLNVAAILHGHYCVGLAMGVMMGAYAMKELLGYSESDGLENLIAIIEMNHCAADGVQIVTGCSFGNNALIYRDIGRTVLILSNRKSKTIKISLKPFAWDKFSADVPGLNELFTKVIKNRDGTKEDAKKLKKLMHLNSFRFIEHDFDDFFTMEKIELDYNSWAPIEETVYCKVCGLGLPESKSIKKNNEIYCKICAKEEYFEVDGRGVHLNHA